MDVVVAGGHGQIGLRLLRLLAERGDRARGLIRTPEYAADLEAAGAEAVLCDMEAEDDLGPFVEGADALVFAAGAGPGSGPERKKTVDLGAALKLIAAAKTLGIRRYVMVSALNADHPERASAAMRPYYEAKGAADEAVQASGLDYAIARPGRLTNDPGTGRVKAGTDIGAGSVTRDDVAATLAEVLVADNTIGCDLRPPRRRHPDRGGSGRPVAVNEARAAEVLERVRSIPEGFVTTYGDLSPGAPRFAGTVLARCHDAAVPWQRVVRADGSLAQGERQRRLLEREGVPFRGERVDMRAAWMPPPERR